jgi:hypothetical protein
MSTTPSPFIENLRKELASHAPGSKERFDLIDDAKDNHGGSSDHDHYIAYLRQRPRGFVPSCPACATMVKRRPGNRWDCSCGAGGMLDEAVFEKQYEAEREQRWRLKEKPKVQRWLDKLETYSRSPASWQRRRQRKPAGVRSSFYEVLRAVLENTTTHATDGYKAVTRMLYDDKLWDRGGDAALYTVLNALDAYAFRTLHEHPWLNVFRCAPERRGLPSIERAWHLLDIIAMCDHRWVFPNTLLEIQTSTDPVASFAGVSAPMRALIKRYVDVRYDTVLSDLLATARRQARKPSKRLRVLKRLEDLRGRADTSPAHLEKWTVVRDHLVNLGYTTVPRANDGLLPRLLDSKALDEDEALLWTQRLLNELLDHPLNRVTYLSEALIAAAGSGWIRVVNLLVEHGAKIDHAGIDAVIEALFCEQHAMVDHLVERGVDMTRVGEAVEDYLDENPRVGRMKRVSIWKFSGIDPEAAMGLRGALRAWEARALRRTVDEVIADLPVAQAAQRRRL